MPAKNMYVGRRNHSLEVITPYFGKKGKDPTSIVIKEGYSVEQACGWEPIKREPRNAE